MEQFKLVVIAISLMLALPCMADESLSDEQCELIKGFIAAVEDITKYDKDPISRRNAYEGALERLRYSLENTGKRMDQEKVNRLMGLATAYKDWASIYATLAQKGAHSPQALDRMALAREHFLNDCQIDE